MAFAATSGKGSEKSRLLRSSDDKSIAVTVPNRSVSIACLTKSISFSSISRACMSKYNSRITPSTIESVVEASFYATASNVHEEITYYLEMSLPIRVAEHCDR